MKTGSVDTVGVLRSLPAAALLLSELPRPELYFSWPTQPHCVVAFARRNLSSNLVMVLDSGYMQNQSPGLGLTPALW